MVSLWGSKKDGEENGTEDVAGHGSDGGPSSRPTSTRDANERTRLLNDGRDHPPPGGRRGDGYLDPDDPAVSLTLLLLTCYAAGCEGETDKMNRYHHTTSGQSVPFATSQSSSP